MIDFELAIVIHVLSVVLWIGGVAMVTTVILPEVRRFKSAPERLAFFDAIERRFSWQARATTVLAAASGFYMCIGSSSGRNSSIPHIGGSMRWLWCGSCLR